MTRLCLAGLYLLGLMIVASCQRQTKLLPTVRVIVSLSRLDSVSVGLYNASRVVVDQNEKRSRIVFPAKVTTCTQTKNRLEYNGIIAEGDGDHIRALAARDPTDSRAVHIMIDTSMELRLEVLFITREETSETPAECKKTERRVAKGKHTILIRREEDQHREDKNSGKKL